jgi:hypothetical protein
VAGQRAWRRLLRPVDLGLGPVVLAVSSLGVLLVALAYAGGRDQRPNSMTVYWIGQAVVFSPVVARLLARRLAGTAEAFLLVMGLAVNQYVMKWAYSPDMFRFPDELQHWLATTLINESGDLFRRNLALPPAVHFPGLAEMGAAVSSLTGLSVTAAGLLVAGVAHLVFVGALFMTVRRSGTSPAVAGLTCVVYATSLHYLFFNSMYLYQTAALPFLMITVWAYRRWRCGHGRGWAVLGLATTLATTVSHHVTAFMLVGGLALLAGSEVAIGRPRRWSALLAPLAAGTVAALWIGLVARDVVAYLGAPVDRIADTVTALLGEQDTGPKPVASVELWQLAVQGLGLLALLGLFLMLARRTWRARSRSPWLWAALLGALVFFAGNGVRFLGASGPEIAGRLSTFTYLPMSVVAALALVRINRIRLRRKRPAQPGVHWGTRIAVGTAVATLLLVGARAGGWPPVWALLPGPHLAAGFERSIDAQGIAAARWMARNPGQRVAADITGVSLASTYGRQDPVRESARLFTDVQWSLDHEDLVTAQYIQYLWVDRRLGFKQAAAPGGFFENDPMAARGPLDPAALRKFDDLPTVDRVYDNGDIRIYQMGYR